MTLQELFCLMPFQTSSLYAAIHILMLDLLLHPCECLMASSHGSSLSSFFTPRIVPGSKPRLAVLLCHSCPVPQQFTTMRKHNRAFTDK